MFPWAVFITFKSAKLTCPYGPMYLYLDKYASYSDKNYTFLRHTLAKTWDVFMDIQIMLNKINWSLGFQKGVGKCLFLNFQKQTKIPFPRTITCNTGEQINVSGDIINDGVYV